MSKEALISPARLRELLKYDPDAGALYWRSRPRDEFASSRTWNAWNARFAGKLAGHTAVRYSTVRLIGTGLLAHRVIWAIHYGTWPNGEIDHISGDGHDNRIVNLRDVPGSVNAKNRRLNCRNRYGIGGLAMVCGKWRVAIRSENRWYHIGSFSDFDSAIAARRAAERQHGFHPNHGRAGRQAMLKFTRGCV